MMVYAWGNLVLAALFIGRGAAVPFGGLVPNYVTTITTVIDGHTSTETWTIDPPGSFPTPRALDKRYETTITAVVGGHTTTEVWTIDPFPTRAVEHGYEKRYETTITRVADGHTTTETWTIDPPGSFPQATTQLIESTLTTATPTLGCRLSTIIAKPSATALITTGPHPITSTFTETIGGKPTTITITIDPFPTRK